MTAASGAPRGIFFPEDLVSSFFEYCDGETLARASSVCKNWSTWASEPDLWHDIISKTQGYTIENRKLPLKDIYKVRHLTLKNLESHRYKTSTLHFTLPGYHVLWHHLDAKLNRLALVWNRTLHVFAIDTGQKEREISHLPASVYRPLLPTGSPDFSLSDSLHLEKVMGYKLVLQSDLIQAIFNMQTLSFEFAYTGKILHEGDGHIVTHDPLGDLEVRDLTTKEVKFSFPCVGFSFYDFKDDLGIIASRQGKVLIFNKKSGGKVCEFQLVGATIYGLKIISQDRLIIQTKENETRLINTQTGEIIKTLPFSLYPRYHLGVDISGLPPCQCGFGKWIAHGMAPGNEKVFVIDSERGDVLKEYMINPSIVKDLFIIHNRLVIITCRPYTIQVYDLVSYALLKKYAFENVSYIEKQSGESHLSDDQELSNIIFFRVIRNDSEYYFLDLSSGKMEQYIPQTGFSWGRVHSERLFSRAHLVDICYQNCGHMVSDYDADTTFKVKISNFLEQAPHPAANAAAPQAASSCVIL